MTAPLDVDARVTEALDELGKQHEPPWRDATEDSTDKETGR